MVTMPLSRDGWLNGIDIMAVYGSARMSECRSLFHTKSKIQRREAKLNLTNCLLVQYGRVFSVDRKSSKVQFSMT